MYVIVNPKTLAQYYGGVFLTQKGAEKARDGGLETYGITTDFKIYKLVEAKATLVEATKPIVTKGLPELLTQEEIKVINRQIKAAAKLATQTE